jgi:hypothetical protein
MLLWSALQIWRKFGVAEECFHTCDNITEVHLEDLSLELQWYLLKGGAHRWKFGIDDLVELIAVLERKPKSVGDLDAQTISNLLQN